MKILPSVCVALFTASSFLFAQDAAPLAPAGAAQTPARPRVPFVMPVPANPNLPTLFLIGDSTVRNGRDDGQGLGPAGQWGWGHTIAELFDTNKINVVNRAVGGLSSRTFVMGNFWNRTLPLIKAGDFVIMQFGTNDSGSINDNFRARASIPGIGDDQQDIDNLLTKKHETVHSYGWYMRKLIDDTRAKGATPIICSMVPKKQWDGAGKIKRNRGDYGIWTEEVARQENVGFIDLNEIAAARYDALGHDQTVALFPHATPDEHTHTNWAGAEVLAQCVVAGLKHLQPDPLAAFYSAKATDVAAADPASPAVPDAESVGFKFQFGADQAAPAYTLVAPDAAYSKDKGYGFEAGPAITPDHGASTDPLHAGAVTSAHPFSFSVAVPEGNYRVTVTLGDPAAAATTTVKAEVRRLMVEHLHTDAGQFVTRTFTVNVRGPRISTGGDVNLDGHEWDIATHVPISRSWDDKLSLTFSDSHPALAAVTIRKVEDVITVFVVGDSTVTDQPRGPGSSWGQMVTRWFKPEVAISNHAESGETLKGFLKERRWDKVLDSMRPGDYALIEFGTNDSKDSGPQNIYPNQDFSETYAPANTTYKELLKRFVSDVQKKGGFPVVLSPSARRGETAHSSLGAYAAAAMAVAKEVGVPSVDLNAMGLQLNVALGQDATRQFNDRTHHVEYGSYMQAKCVVAGIKADQLPLAKLIVDDFGDFDPQHPQPTPDHFLVPTDATGERRRPGPPATAPATPPAATP
jgi:lysophospholipase L1-like esterase